MSRKKIILLALLVVFIALQFFQPAQNRSDQETAAEFTKIYAVPDQIQDILKTACYNCHSNNTRYPWYAYVQPAGWMLARHIRKGKAELNFSEFGSYSSRMQAGKLKEIANQIKHNEMPLSSYKILHKNARLSDEQKNLLITWMNNAADSISSGN